MSEPIVTRSVTVPNREGLHLRVAVLLAQTVRRFQAKVAFIKERHRVEGTDVLQLVSLGATEGEQLRLEATGPEAEAALDAIVQLFVDHFDENAPTQRQEQ